MSQPCPSLPMTIVPLKIANELLAAGLTHGGPFYLIYEQPSQRFSVVWWERLRWQCSCKKAKCPHVQTVSTFLLEEVHKRRITGNDLEAHVEDDLGLNR